MGRSTWRSAATSALSDGTSVARRSLRKSPFAFWSEDKVSKRIKRVKADISTERELLRKHHAAVDFQIESRKWFPAQQAQYRGKKALKSFLYSVDTLQPGANEIVLGLQKKSFFVSPPHFVPAIPSFATAPVFAHH